MSALHEPNAKLLPHRRTVLGAALMLVSLWPAAASALEVSCVADRVTARAVSSGGGSTNSNSFVNVPDTAVDVTIGGANPTCVIVVFTAHTQTTSNENMAIRARLEGGGGNSTPSEYATGPGTGVSETRTAQFIFDNVEPGTYTARMQFRSISGGTTVTLGRPTIVVHHR